MIEELITLLLEMLIGHGSTPHALIQRAAVLLLAGPWLALIAWDRKRSWTYALCGGVLIVYLFDRLIEDFTTFAPPAALVAGAWLMLSVFRADRRSPYRRALLVLTPLGGAGLAAMLVHMPAGGIAFALASFVLMLAYGDPTQSLTRSLVVRMLGGTVVSVLVLQGLAATFLGLLLGGSIGWLGVGFACWRSRRRGAARLFGVGATVVAAGLLTWLPAELYFRYVYDTSDANNLLCTHRRWEDRHVERNDWGYRDEAFDPLARFDDHLRVVLLGDSFAFAQGIHRVEDTPAGQLQSALSQRLGTTRPVKVFNVSRGGATIQGESSMFQRDGVRLRPDVVVWQYLTNDADDMLDLRDRHRGHPALDPWRPVLDASCSLEFLAWRLYERIGLRGIDRLAGSIGVYADDEKFSQHVKEIDALLGMIRATGARPVVWLFPLLDRPADDGPQGRALDRLEQCFAERQVPTFSVRAHVKTGGSEQWVNRFDPHPSAALHRTMTPALADLVRETLDEDGVNANR
jgi:hypothetical protein